MTTRKPDTAWGFFRSSYVLGRALEWYRSRKHAEKRQRDSCAEGDNPGPVFRITPPKRKARK